MPDSLALPWLRSDAPVTDDHPVSCDEIFVSVEWLPPDCCPAPVVRHLGLTSLTVEVLADRYELLRYMRDNLTDEEQGELFGRFGWPEGTVPLRWLDEVGPIPVPEALWWPHEGRWSAS